MITEKLEKSRRKCKAYSLKTFLIRPLNALEISGETGNTKILSSFILLSFSSLCYDSLK